MWITFSNDRQTQDLTPKKLIKNQKVPEAQSGNVNGLFNALY